MTNVMHTFLIYFPFTSALHVSGFLLVHLQRQVYNFGSGSSLLGIVSTPGRWHHTSVTMVGDKSYDVSPTILTEVAQQGNIVAP
jgi:hypothetical protein